MARLPLRSIYPFTRCQPIKQGEQNEKTGKNLCDSHDVTSTTDCLCRNESKDITVSGTRNIPTPPFLSHGGKIGNYTWTYPPNYHPSLLERQRWGWSQAFSSKLFTNVVFTRYRYIYTRTPSTHGKRSDVFITARNALSTEYHFRGTSYHCNEPRFMLKCTRCAHTCHTAPPLTSPPYSAYLLTSPTIRSREISGLMFLWFFARIIVESGQRANFRPVRGRFEQARRREDRISGRTRADDRLAICRSRRSVEEYFATTGMMMTRYTEIIRGEATSHSTFEYLSRVNCLERIRKEDNKITLGINIMARVTEV